MLSSSAVSPSDRRYSAKWVIKKLSVVHALSDKGEHVGIRANRANTYISSSSRMASESSTNSSMTVSPSPRMTAFLILLYHSFAWSLCTGTRFKSYHRRSRFQSRLTLRHPSDNARSDRTSLPSVSSDPLRQHQTVLPSRRHIDLASIRSVVRAWCPICVEKVRSDFALIGISDILPNDELRI